MKKKTQKKGLEIFLFALWYLALSVPLSYMMGPHLLSLYPSSESKLLELATGPKYAGEWKSLHFLNSDCECSRNVYSSLLKRGPNETGKEVVFLFGKAGLWQSELEKIGFEVKLADAEEFGEKYALNAVPQLTIIGPSEKVLYNGGYSMRRGPASTIEDLLILDEVKHNETVKARPIFGCVSGKNNRLKTDPFKLKY